jgi:tetratricopeptide (TPR) repeat protein
VALGAFGLCVAVVPVVQDDPWAAKAAVLAVLGAAGIPVLLVRALGRNAPARTTWAARAALAFVLWAGLSTLFATLPQSALVGRFGQGTGWLFFAALAGCWALGTRLNDADRSRLGSGILAGAALTAFIVLIQTQRDLSSLALANYGGRPSGLQGNPVFVASLLAAAVALLAPRCAAPARWPWAVALLFGAGLGASGERWPALLALSVLVAVFAVAWRRRSDDHPRSATTEPRLALGFGALVVGGLVLGSLAGRVGGQPAGVIAATSGSTGSETYGERFRWWGYGLHALAHRPLLGYGPNQFTVATTHLATAAAERKADYGLLADAHNLGLEVAIATGLVGLVLALAWFVLGASDRRGALLACALVLLATELVEPLNVTITPLAALALGAAAARRPTDRAGPVPRPVARAGLLCAILAAVPAVLLVTGDVALAQGYSSYEVSDIGQALSRTQVAETLLAPWPEPADQLAQIQYFRAIDRRPGAIQAAEHWAQVAAAKDPSYVARLTALARDQLWAYNLSGAAATGREMLRQDPWSSDGWLTLGIVADARGDRAQAVADWRQALALQPNQPSLRREVAGKCPPVTHHPQPKGCLLGPGPN